MLSYAQQGGDQSISNSMSKVRLISHDHDDHHDDDDDHDDTIHRTQTSLVVPLVVVAISCFYFFYYLVRNSYHSMWKLLGSHVLGLSQVKTKVHYCVYENT